MKKPVELCWAQLIPLHKGNFAGDGYDNPSSEET